jgi:hypothetical protein
MNAIHQMNELMQLIELMNSWIPEFHANVKSNQSRRYLLSHPSNTLHLLLRKWIHGKMIRKRWLTSPYRYGQQTAILCLFLKVRLQHYDD